MSPTLTRPATRFDAASSGVEGVGRAIAHRGRSVRGGGEHPENTLAAFTAAVAAGAEGIETDVRLSRDGQAVLFHDRRVADGREVAALTVAELRSAAGYPVPTLGEALENFPEVFWNLELKVPAVAPAVLAQLERGPSNRGRGGERFLISSFWHPAVLPFTVYPGVECALLMPCRPESFDVFACLFPRDGSIRTAVWSYEMLDVDLLEQGRALGFRSYVYGVETVAEHQRCAELPLAGVITDHLERVERVERAVLR